MALHHPVKRKRGAYSSDRNVGTDDIVSPIIVNGKAVTSSYGICSMRDNDEPKSHQSSLLSFFVQKKMKPKHKSTYSSTCSSNIRNIIRSSAITTTSTFTSYSPADNRGVDTESASSIAETIPSTSRSSHRSTQKSLTQVYIDCGQSNFGQILCDTCGMLYMPGVVEDEVQHMKLCQAYTQGIPTVRGIVKGGRHVPNGDSATIVLWRPSGGINRMDKRQMHNTTNDITNYKHLPSQWPLLAQMISKDLGTHEQSTLNHINNNIVFLYIGNVNNSIRRHKNSINSCSSNNNKHNQNQNGPNRIIGAVTVQILSEAYRMLSLHERSLTPERAKLGIGLLWTHPMARHKGIATRLVNAARDHTIFGMRIAQHDVAFSSPTQAGYDFALHFCSDDNNNNCNIRFNNDERCNDNKYNQQQQQHQQDSYQIRPLVYEMHL
mmetsp:Transcript_45507/g.50670  ORF Transcript_45507/g.50670 Transcript_45507/m.50670 type:complete len:435 (-) Transcript_45507:246-1550(-)